MNSFNKNQWNSLRKKGYTLEVEFIDGETGKTIKSIDKNQNKLDTLAFKSEKQLREFLIDFPQFKISCIVRNESFACVNCGFFVETWKEIEKGICENCKIILEKNSEYDYNYEISLFNSRC